MSREKTIFGLIVCFFVISNSISCVKSNTRESLPVSNSCSGTPGPLFTAVKNLVSQNCVSCHNNVITNGGMNFTVDCNIVTHQSIIKFKVVDEGSMPATGPLPQSERAKITNWVNAGGKYTD